MNEKGEAIPKPVSEKRGIMHSAPSPCLSFACRCVLACRENPSRKDAGPWGEGGSISPCRVARGERYAPASIRLES